MAIIRGTYVTRLSGAVGDVVYRMRNGKNIASQKASQVKNPRTDAQQNQRMNMATVSAAYSALKVICDHSFEGKTYGSECMGEFMKRNLAIMKPRLFNFNIKGNPYIVPNPYMVSRGSLPTIPVSSITNTDILIANVDVATNEYAAETITVAQLHQLLGLQIGDQITLLFVYEVVNGERTIFEGISPQNQFAVGYARFTADTTKANLETMTAFTEDGLLNDWVDTSLSENYNNVKCVSIATNELALALSVPNGDSSSTIVAGTVIASRKQGNDWLRSTQMLTLSGVDAESWERTDVIKSYLPTGNKYLNNASL